MQWAYLVSWLNPNPIFLLETRCKLQPISNLQKDFCTVMIQGSVSLFYWILWCDIPWLSEYVISKKLLCTCTKLQFLLKQIPILQICVRMVNCNFWHWMSGIFSENNLLAAISWMQLELVEWFCQSLLLTAVFVVYIF